MSVYTYNWGNFADQTIITDSDGFAPPQYGGVVNVKAGTLYGSQGTNLTYLFTLPKDAVPVFWVLNVKTVFNGSGANNVDLGDGTTVNLFADALSLAAEAQVTTGFEFDFQTPLTADTGVFATNNGTTPTTGEADIICFYIMPNRA